MERAGRGPAVADPGERYAGPALHAFGDGGAGQDRDHVAEHRDDRDVAAVVSMLGDMVSILAGAAIETTAMLLPSSRIHPKWVLRSRPRVGPSRRAMYWHSTSRGLPPRTKTAPRLRISGVMRSPRSRA